MKFNIASLPGDGIGPEVSGAVAPILNIIGDRFGHQFFVQEYLIGGAAIDDLGDPLPSITLDACKKADAVFLACIGGPKCSERLCPSARRT